MKRPHEIVDECSKLAKELRAVSPVFGERIRYKVTLEEFVAVAEHLGSLAPIKTMQEIKQRKDDLRYITGIYVCGIRIDKP